MPLAGVYSALPHPLQAFASDVRYAASLLQAGCNKTHSLFAQEYAEKREWGCTFVLHVYRGSSAVWEASGVCDSF